MSEFYTYFGFVPFTQSINHFNLHKPPFTTSPTFLFQLLKLKHIMYLKTQLIIDRMIVVVGIVVVVVIGNIVWGKQG